MEVKLAHMGSFNKSSPKDWTCLEPGCAQQCPASYNWRAVVGLQSGQPKNAS